jgi:site-specific recombinase XerD
MSRTTVPADSAAPTGWVDHGVVPPRRLPSDPTAIAAYLADALGHPVYERWTWTRLIKAYGTLPDARRIKPAVCRLLIDVPEVVDVWHRGRLIAQPSNDAASIEAVVLALLKSHGGRFKAAPIAALVTSSSGASRPGAAAASDDLRAFGNAVPSNMDGWLQRRGRLVNPHDDTNTLGAIDDHAATAAFLRERATRSHHTWRAYTTELQRLMAWCIAHGLGPLSDLTRQDLLAYRQWLARPGDSVAPGTGAGQQAPATAPSARSQARALAVVASLFRYWHDTGYLLGNPAAGLGGGSRWRAGFDSQRFVPEALLTTCDAWVTRSVAALAPEPERVSVWRRAAIWTLFRFAGVRLAELAWQPGTGLPRLEVDERGNLTLHVIGKGSKARSIPLPQRCADVLRHYRRARGLPARPTTLEHMPLIHGEKASALGSRGLYDEVKAVLLAVADEVLDEADVLLLRSVSPHWLRHAYARTLVVDQGVPLPAAQALLGHASVQTTAEYAKTDLSTLRAFVDKGFAKKSA